MRRTLDMMDRQLSHLVRLVDDLLDVGRVVSGKLDIKHEPVSLAQVLAAGIDASRALIESRGHHLSVDIGQDEVIVVGDFDRLFQVFTNILTNAAKYTDPGGSIMLSCRREGHSGVVETSDSGIGIPPDDVANVFDMFSQVRSHQGRTADGLGIGLALVKRIVELHGGIVNAHSPGVAQGSKFTVRLPIAATQGTLVDNAADFSATNPPM